jgi:uncharacterized protein YndB with AHSA1/START domain
MNDLPSVDPATLGEVTRCYSLRYRRHSKHPPARLWRAITDPDEIERWMGYPARVDLRVGGDYFVDFQTSSPDNLDGVIVAVEPERRLAYAWGLSVIQWTLTPDDGGSGTAYTFVDHGTQIRHVPDEEGVAVGWHAWLDRLDAMLDGAEPLSLPPRTRDALSAAYHARIEDAIGPL